MIIQNYNLKEIRLNNCYNFLLYVENQKKCHIAEMLLPSHHRVDNDNFVSHFLLVISVFLWKLQLQWREAHF